MLWFVLGFLFLLTRVWSLTALPMFNDEASYLRWGWEILHGIKPWWYSIVVNGKPPLTMIVYGIAQWFPVDQLLAGRLMAVCFSALTALISLKTYAMLFPKQSFLLYGLLLIFNPFLLFFDRLALSEAIVTAIGSLLLYAGLRYVQTKQLRWIICIGACLGIGWWVKTTVFGFIPVLCLMGVWLGVKKRIGWDRLMLVVILILLAVVLIIFPSGFHPTLASFDTGEAKWMFSLSELLRFPVSVWGNNMANIVTWFLVFPTPVYVCCWLIGAILCLKQAGNRSSLLLYSLWVAVPILLFLVLGKNLTGRYVVIIMPQLSALAAYGVYGIWKKWKRLGIALGSIVVIVVVGVGTVLTTLPQTYFQLISAFPRAYWDMAQYMTGWPSGYGVREAITFVEKQARTTPLILFVRNDTGNPEDAVFVYCRSNPRITIIPVITKQDVAKAVLSAPNGMPLYFLSRGPAMLGMNGELTELVRFPKPTGVEYVGVYRVERK